MKSLKAPFNAKLLTHLHRAACAREVVDKKDHIRSSFGLTIGKNMTPEGRDELLAFARELRKTLPGYVVTESRNDFIAYEKHWDKTLPGDDVATPPEPTGDEANAAHIETSFATLAKHIDHFIDDYERRCPTARPKTSGWKTSSSCAKSSSGCTLSPMVTRVASRS